MPIEVFDFRRDVKNLFISPEIRARFMRMEPGEVHARHSHDLGHEVFLVLDGRCQMEIEGDVVVLGPGQMCVARADEMHQASNPFPEPMTMYLSVTPHIEPTHTMWDEHGRKRPPRYAGSLQAGRANLPPPDESVEHLAGRLLAAAKALGAVAHNAGEVLEGPASELTGADPVAAKSSVDAAWAEIYRIRRSLRDVEDAWNLLAERVGGSGQA